jgi:hypothetical protein
MNGHNRTGERFQSALMMPLSKNPAEPGHFNDRNYVQWKAGLKKSLFRLLQTSGIGLSEAAVD